MPESGKIHEVANLMPGFLFVYEEFADGRSSFPYASARAEDLLAVSLQDLREDGGAAWARLHPEDVEKMRSSIDRATAQVSEWRCAFRVLHPDYGVVWLEGRAMPERLADGRLRWHGFQHDVTDARRAQAELEAKSVQIDQLLELSIDLVGVVQPDMQPVRISQAWSKLFGVPMERLINMRYDQLIVEEDLPRFLRTLRRAAKGDEIQSDRTRWRRPDGQVLVTDWWVQRGRDGQLYIVARDITGQLVVEQTLREAKATAERRAKQLQEANKQAEHAALHDALTGLPNRRSFGSWMAEGGPAGDGVLTVLHLDLDGFKEINDRFGHPIGDEVLRRSAAQLNEQMRAGDFLARVGGDEFIVVSRRFEDAEAAIAFGRLLIDAVASPFLCGDWFHRIGVSVGVAVSADARAELSALRSDADIALYRAKAAGGGRVELFSESMRAQMRRRKATAARIEVGLHHDEFEPFYQPQICARSGKVAAIEALARWRRPDEGVLGPDQFIAPAEEMNLIAELDRRIMARALEDANRLRSMFGEAPRLSVNVSARRLRQPGLVQEIRALALRPGALSFELVESIFMEEAESEALRIAEALRGAGVDIELDDFGSGHASVVGLLRLRPSRLKIDQRLVRPMLDSAESLSLVRAMVDIGRAVGVGVVAEGVETFDHARALADMGCALLQGYAFAKPVPFSELTAMLDERPWLCDFSGREQGASSDLAAPASIAQRDAFPAGIGAA